MSFNKIFYLILFCFFVYSCSSTKEEKISILEEKSLDLQMIDAYKEGLEELEVNGDALYAAKKFNEAELLYPQSVWASRSALMAAYAYYSQNYFDDAVFELERFLKVYPNNKRLDYANYLLAMVYYEKVVDEKKDIGPLLKSKNHFEYVINNYPNTDFAFDSDLKLDLINDILASKEMYIGRYYFKKKKWISAINRFKTVIDEYETTIYAEEALHRLVEVYYTIGLEVEAKKYAKLLGYNYQSSQWYEKSYSVFDKTYKKNKKANFKKNKSLIKKFKSLLN